MPEERGLPHAGIVLVDIRIWHRKARPASGIRHRE
jgi:hypothetical protein